MQSASDSKTDLRRHRPRVIVSIVRGQKCRSYQQNKFEHRLNVLSWLTVAPTFPLHKYANPEKPYKAQGQPTTQEDRGNYAVLLQTHASSPY